MRGIRRPTEADHGASAVEFALIAGFLLFPLIFGMIQYGMFFYDSMNVRQGVREAAREAVVELPASACSGTGMTWTRLTCETKARIGAVTGTPVVKAGAPQGWAQGKPLVVCAAMKSSGVFGLLPLPNSGAMLSVSQFSIEQDAAPLPGASPAAPTDPSGSNWNWCPLP